jgi:hypothetical protein
MRRGNNCFSRLDKSRKAGIFESVEEGFFGVVSLGLTAMKIILIFLKPLTD